jgi:hypothetical protein
MSTSLVRNAIMPWKAMLALSFITTLVIGAQLVIGGAVAEGTVVQEDVSCTVTSVNDAKGKGLFGSDGTPWMQVNCGEKNYNVQAMSLLVSYLQKPQPLICDITKLNGASCHLSQEQK